MVERRLDGQLVRTCVLLCHDRLKSQEGRARAYVAPRASSRGCRELLVSIWRVPHPVRGVVVFVLQWVVGASLIGFGIVLPEVVALAPLARGALVLANRRSTRERSADIDLLTPILEYQDARPLRGLRRVMPRTVRLWCARHSTATVFPWLAESSPDQLASIPSSRASRPSSAAAVPASVPELRARPARPCPSWVLQAGRVEGRRGTSTGPRVIPGNVST